MTAQNIWVVFTDHTDLPWLKFLRRGFRHCFVVIQGMQGGWISIDPLAHRLEIHSLGVLADFDLPKWLEAQGYTVLPARVQESNKVAPIMPMSCVEVVKRIIGIHNRRILTPWQLYRHLKIEI